MNTKSGRGRVPPPSRRPLKIFAVDPMMGRTFGNRATIHVTNESLKPGPSGKRIEVVDYDGNNKIYYTPVDLNQSSVLMQGGLDPSESDPRFHQQMVYGVAMKTIENFDRALGRPIKLSTRRHEKLRLLPHAFFGANAYYDPKLNAILFGYFRADSNDPGDNLPDQVVFTCLSHDVIAHEVTHKVVDRLRPLFLEPSNEDVLAFHEGFADIVALFQHFSFSEVVRDQIARSRSDLTSPTTLVELARQFGHATGSGQSLRSALDKKPDPSLYKTLMEPHARGSILVSAVFDGFQKVYKRKTYDLIRIATGGTGVLPTGELHPDLVNRIATEASRTAQRVLDMCIRAFDYLPPVDINFGDFLRAMITADYELIPDDDLNLRGAMIEAFRVRGIYPAGVLSLAEESLLWPTGKDVPAMTSDVQELISRLFFLAVLDLADVGADLNEDEPTQESSEAQQLRDFYKGSSFVSTKDEDGDSEPDSSVTDELADKLRKYAVTNANQLGLSPGLTVEVRGFHPVFRVAPTGRLVIELVAQFAQKNSEHVDAHGGLPFRAGTTLIASADGAIRYLIEKPMLGAQNPEKQSAAQLRFDRQERFVKQTDESDLSVAYMSPQEYGKRMTRLMDLARLHG